MTGTKPQIVYFLSASDRINYGDLLFPLVFQAFAKDAGYSIDFRNYGVVSSNLTHFKALPTSSYASLLKDLKREPGKLVIGGGEVFFASWSTLYAFIQPLYSRLMRKPRFKRLLQRYAVASRLLGTRAVQVPFCPLPSELGVPDLPIYYSSVGGAFTGSPQSGLNSHLHQALAAARLVSVRDERSFNSMKEHSVSAQLVPDSALLMSELFPISFLETQLSFSPNLFSTPYLYLQLGSYKGPTDLKSFAVSLRALADSLGLQVVLCPIGLAPGHEDDTILKALAALDTTFRYVQPQSVYDVMYLIAKSKLYLGTSLHGIITAQSFGVTCFGLNPKLSKVSSYIQTWIDPTFSCFDFESLTEVSALYRNWPSERISLQTAEQKQRIVQNLHQILQDL